MQASCRARTPAIIITNSAFGIELKALGVYGTSSGPDSRSVSLLISTPFAGAKKCAFGQGLSASVGARKYAFGRSMSASLGTPGLSQSNMEVSESF